MKKVYLKPEMQVIELRQQPHLLAGSQLSVPVNDDDEITNEEDVW